MKKLILALGFCLLASAASAQCNGVFPANTVCGNLTLSPAPPSAVPFGGTIVGPGTTVVNDFVQWNNTTGTSIKDSGFTTGTSGHAIPFLDGTNAWSGANTFPSIGLNGSGSGTISILPQAAAGTYNFNLPTTAGAVGQVLTSAGGAGAPMTWATLQNGFVTAYYNGTAWVAQKEDGTFISTGSTTTCAAQEAINYAASSGRSLRYFGQGSANICNVVANTTITFPAAYHVSYFFYGAYFNFTNAGQNGFLVDTQRYATLYYDGSTFYQGTQNAWAFAPQHGPAAISCASNSTACWDLDNYINIGTIFISAGATANACIQINPSLGGSTGLTATQWVENIVYFNACEGQQNANYGIQFVNGNNAFANVGENTFTFGNIEGLITTGIQIGQSATTPAEGTNIFNGNVQVTGTGVGTIAITSFGQLDIFNLQSVNCNQNQAGQQNIIWGLSANLNTIYTPQMLPCAGAAAPVVTDNSTAKTNNIYILPNFTTPIPRLVAGLPACATLTEGWTYVVTNNNTAQSWNGAVTTGGTTVSFVKCDATGSWKQF